MNDLQNSIQDRKVLEYMRENNLLPLYIPAGCTGIMQASDTVAKKPFKVGLKAGFCNYLYEKYNKWIAINYDKETRGQWNPQ